MEASPETQLRALIGKFEPKHQKLIRSVRTALRKRFPTANELVYDYGHLVIAYSPNENGISAPVSLTARKDSVELYFNHGPKLPDPKKLLSGAGKQTRFVKLESARQLANPDVEGFIAASIKLSSPALPARGKGALIIKSKR